MIFRSITLNELAEASVLWKNGYEELAADLNRIGEQFVNGTTPADEEYAGDPHRAFTAADFNALSEDELDALPTPVQVIGTDGQTYNLADTEILYDTDWKILGFRPI